MDKVNLDGFEFSVSASQANKKQKANENNSIHEKQRDRPLSKNIDSLTQLSELVFIVIKVCVVIRNTNYKRYVFFYISFKL
jgi:hypothetical protein